MKLGRVAGVAGLLAISLAACQASGSATPPRRGAIPPANNQQPVPSAAHWHLVFDDEFTGHSLNTAHWSTGWLAPGITPPVDKAELECYAPADVTVTGGALRLKLVPRPAACGGKDRPYSSGLVNTDGKFHFTYGFLEARMRMRGLGRTIANWPAFWADGQHWPQDGEIDVLEGLSGQACWHFVNRAGSRGGCAAGTFTNGWHTFGADWEPGSVTYYYDGRRVGQVTSGITSSPMFLILNNATSHDHGAPIRVPATVSVSYVRVWQKARRS